MCLTVSPKYHSSKKKSRITKRDIFILKIAENITKKHCSSFFRSEKQPFNKELTSKFSFYESSVGLVMVEQGLHGIISPQNSIEYWFDCQKLTSVGVILCKIPKGSEVFVGMFGEIASNKLVLQQPILVNKATRSQLDTKVEEYWADETDEEFWEECFKIAEDLGYKIGLSSEDLI